MTDLKDKAIDIKGKLYVLVSDRVVAFNDVYKNGNIQTNLVSFDNNRFLLKAKVTPDADKPERYFTGYSQAVVGEGMVNKTAALENAETSAVGRALAFMGIGVIDSIASVDEIKKAVHDPVDDWAPDTNTDSQATYADTNEMCPEHNTAYRKFSKNGRTWESHKIEGTDAWCNKK